MGFPSFFILILAFQVVLVSSIEFNVGGKKGWVVPQSKDDQHYNDWASENRFKVDDTLNFEFKDDSVLVVTEEEYEKCISARPMFFSNNGNTVFKLNRPGLFYFISGVSGHCSKGLKMIVKVLDIQSPSPQSANQTTGSHKAHSGAIELKSAFLPIVIPIVGGLFLM
ncbi:hypothetical protein LIER_20974 [Lithospermum erythrorhizon]|uniref:Phytocyanin domain-containing protein n=1 Tax=Lithospermum erythrorhizon TaxID=34254 RepID=A0AAV3QNG6_LITER